MTMPTVRGQQLQTLMGKLPVANQKVVQGLQEGQRTRMGASLVPPGAPGITPNMNQISAAGAQTTADQGQTALKGQTQTVQQRGQLQGQAVAEQQRAGGQVLAQAEQGASQENRRQADLLAHIDQDLKTKLIDQQMQFQRDQGGNVLFNTRQLTDWAAANARSEQDFKNRVNVMDQAASRKVSVMKQANALLKQALEQGYLKGKQILDQKLKRDLLERQQAIEKEIQKEENKAASKRMMGAGIGTIVGLGVGVGAAALSGGAATPLIPVFAAAGGAAGSQVTK